MSDVVTKDLQDSTAAFVTAIGSLRPAVWSAGRISPFISLKSFHNSMISLSVNLGEHEGQLDSKLT